MVNAMNLNATDKNAASGSGSGALPELIRELMARYDAYRAMWVDEFGNADGFDAWFTSKALSPSSGESR